MRTLSSEASDWRPPFILCKEFGSSVGVTVGVGVGDGVDETVAVGKGVYVGVISGPTTGVAASSSQAETNAMETRHRAHSIPVQSLPIKVPLSATVRTDGQFPHRPRMWSSTVAIPLLFVMG